jgi:hypothetical protein
MGSAERKPNEPVEIRNLAVGQAPGDVRVVAFVALEREIHEGSAQREHEQADHQGQGDFGST